MQKLTYNQRRYIRSKLRKKWNIRTGKRELSSIIYIGFSMAQNIEEDLSKYLLCLMKKGYCVQLEIDSTHPQPLPSNGGERLRP